MNREREEPAAVRALRSVERMQAMLDAGAWPSGLAITTGERLLIEGNIGRERRIAALCATGIDPEYPDDATRAARPEPAALRDALEHLDSAFKDFADYPRAEPDETFSDGWREAKRRGYEAAQGVIRAALSAVSGGVEDADTTMTELLASAYRSGVGMGRRVAPSAGGTLDALESAVNVALSDGPFIDMLGDPGWPGWAPELVEATDLHRAIFALDKAIRAYRARLSSETEGATASAGVAGSPPAPRSSGTGRS